MHATILKYGKSKNCQKEIAKQQAWKIVATKVKYDAYLRDFWWVIRIVFYSYSYVMVTYSYRSQRKFLLQVNSVNISGVN